MAGATTLDYSITSTNATQDINNTTRVFLIVGEVWNAILIVITLWILISMIIYGSKHKRWKKSSGSSSLNSGIVYISCLAIDVATLVKLIISAVLFHLPQMMDPKDYCEKVMDIDNAATCVTLYTIYFFLWLRQKLIYKHPSVKTLAGKGVKATSWVSLFVLAFIFTLVTLYFVLPENSYTARNYGCIGMSLEQDAFPGIKLSRAAGFYLLGAGFLLSQVTLLSLFIYPVVRNDVVLGQAKRTDPEVMEPMESAPSGLFTTCWRVIAGNPMRETSPVTIIIRRSMISCMVTCVANLMATLLAGLAAQYITQSMINPAVNSALTVALICCVTSIGNVRELLTILCIKCGAISLNRVIRREMRHSQIRQQNNVI